MSLEKCKECGKEISSSAKSCPQCGAARKSEKSGSGCLIFVLVAIAILIGFSFAGKSIQSSDKAARAAAIKAGAWRTDFNLAISKSLAKGGATGCGEFKYLSVGGDSEYVVECFDGTRTRFYQVWPKIESIVGPYDSIPDR